MDRSRINPSPTRDEVIESAFKKLNKLLDGPGVGDVVTFIGLSKDQINWGSGDDPKEKMRLSENYKIKGIEVHTLFSFEGVEGKFNSVGFL